MKIKTVLIVSFIFAAVFSPGQVYAQGRLGLKIKNATQNTKKKMSSISITQLERIKEETKKYIIEELRKEDVSTQDAESSAQLFSTIQILVEEKIARDRVATQDKQIFEGFREEDRAAVIHDTSLFLLEEFSDSIDERLPKDWYDQTGKLRLNEKQLATHEPFTKLSNKLVPVRFTSMPTGALVSIRKGDAVKELDLSKSYPVIYLFADTYAIKYELPGRNASWTINLKTHERVTFVSMP